MRRSSEIRELLVRGDRKRTAVVEIFVSASPESHSRLGLVVPKHGRRIVDRNRLKRRLREIGRRRVLPKLDASGIHCDILIRATRRAYDADFDLLSDDVTSVVEVMCSPAS